MSIMELIDAYAEANRAEANVLEQGTDAELVEAYSDTRRARTAVVEAVEKLERDAAMLRSTLETCVCAMQDYQAGIGITEMFDKGERMGRLALIASRKAVEATNGQGN